MTSGCTKIVSYIARGDKVNAALSLTSMIPFAGYGASAVKFGKRIETAIEKGKDVMNSAKVLLKPVTEKATKQVEKVKVQFQTKVDEVKQQMRELCTPKLQLATAGVDVRLIDDSRNFKNSTTSKREDNKGTSNVPKVTKGYDVTPLKSTYQERLNQTPVNNGKWTGERGESTFISDKPEVKPFVEKAGVKGVEYKNAMPDFSPFSKVEFEITGMSSSRPSNFSKADELLAKQWSTPEKQWTKAEVAKWRAQNKYTWHELNDGKTIQLIPSSVNSNFGHLGGVSEVK